MCKTAFGFGLVISLAIHAWLILSKATPWAEPEMNDTDPQRRPIMEVARIVDTPLPGDSVNDKQKAPSTPLPPAKENLPVAAKTRKPAAVPLIESARPMETKEGDGDLAGASDGVRRAMLRIDWGTPEEAAQIIEAGRMKLAVLRSDNRFFREVIRDKEGWHDREFRVLPGVDYSNSLRIVTGVTAFRPAMRAAAMTNGERLAVLIPTQVEEMLTAAQLEAAKRHGADVSELHTIGGRFRAGSSGVWFDVTGIRMRREE